MSDSLVVTLKPLSVASLIDFLIVFNANRASLICLAGFVLFFLRGAFFAGFLAGVASLAGAGAGLASWPGSATGAILDNSR